MGLVLLAAFIGVPLIEIGLFIKVGGLIGLWPTLFVVVATAMAGTALLRHQGLGTLQRLQDSLNRGEAPIDPVFDGFCLLAAGLLLLTPGFFTDALGFLLFVPPVRDVLKRATAHRFQMHAEMRGPGGTTSQTWHGPGTSPSPGGDDVIDVDYTDVTDKKSPDDDPNTRLPHDKA